MPRYLIYSDPDDGVLTGLASPTFSTAQDTVASATGSGTGFTVSQQSDGTNYTFYQSDVHFDLSAVSTVGAASLTLTPFTPVYTTADTVEVRGYAWTTPVSTATWVPGSSIATTCPTLVGSITTGTGGTWAGGSSSAATITLDATGLTGGAVNGFLLNVASQRAGTDNGTLANKSGAGIYSADQAGTSQDPTLTITSGTYLRGTGAVTSVPSGNLALAYPTATSGDLLLALVVARDNVVSTMPSGWTLKQGTNNGTSLRTEVWEQTTRATGTESGTVTVTRSSGGSAQGWMASVAGAVSSGEAIEAIAASANASSTTVTFPALTTLTNGADVFALQAMATAATFGLPSGTDPAFVDDLDTSYDPRPPLAPDYTNTAGGGTTSASSLAYSYGTPTTGTNKGGTSVIALNVKSGTATLAAVTGWTTYGPFRNLSTSPTATTWVLVKTITAGESGSITLNWGTAAKYEVIELGFSNTNAAQLTPVAQTNTSGTSATLPTITPTANNGVRLAIVGAGAAQTLSSATGFSNITSVTSTGGNASTQAGLSVAVGTAYTTSGSPTGTTTLTMSGTDSGAATVHLVLAATSPSASPVSAAFSDGTKTTAGSIAAPSATSSVAGINTGILFAVTPAASGPSPVSGTAASKASGVSQSASGTYTPQAITGTAAQAASGAAQSATGVIVGNVTGTATNAASGASQSATGSLAFRGTATSASAGASQSASGALAFSGSAASTSAGVSQGATGTYTPIPITGTAGNHASGPLQAATGVQGTSTIGTAQNTAAGLTQAASGTYTPLAITGSATSTTGHVGQALTASLLFGGTASQAAAGLAQSLAGGLAFTGTAHSTAAGVTQQAASAPSITGTASSTSAGLSQVATGALTFSGIATSAAGGVTQALRQPSTPAFTVLGVWSAIDTTPVVSAVDATPILTLAATTPVVAALDTTPKAAALLTTPSATGIGTTPTITAVRSTPS